MKEHIATVANIHNHTYTETFNHKCGQNPEMLRHTNTHITTDTHTHTQPQILRHTTTYTDTQTHTHTLRDTHT